MRALKSTAPELPKLSPKDTWEIPIRAVTPIYKGGCNPKGIDENIPFRGPSLKGALRYWWRATQETRSVDQLREAEGRLFGRIFGEGETNQIASKVRLGVTKLKSTAAPKPEKLGWITWVSRREDDAKPFHAAGATATLRVSTSEHPDQVLRAVQAMLLFGGTGSRSRRGLGALWTQRDSALKVLPSFKSPVELLDFAQALAPTAVDRKWPSLGGAHLAIGGESFTDPVAALRKGHDNFQAIRGMKSLGGKGFTGKHRHPAYQREWEAVRSQNNGQSGRPTGVTAALGMPLTYQSSNGHLKKGKVAFNPAGKNLRFPSPVLLKPMQIAGEWRPCFLIHPLWARPMVEAGRHKVGPLPTDALSPFIDALSAGNKSWGDYTVHSLSKAD